MRRHVAGTLCAALLGWGCSDPAPGDDGLDPEIEEHRPPPPPGCGEGVLEGAIYLERGPQELERLAGIGTITGDLVVDETDVESLVGLECLVEIGGDLQVFGNPELVDLGGLDNLWRVRGHVVVSENPRLTSVGLHALRYAGHVDTELGEELRIGGLVIKSNPGLQELTGLTSLQEVRGGLFIQFNEGLRHIDDLRALRVVDGLFAVTHNPALCLSSINAVGAGLEEGPDTGSSTRNNDPGC